MLNIEILGKLTGLFLHTVSSQLTESQVNQFSRDSGCAHSLELLSNMWTHTLIYIASFLLDAIIIKSFIICSVRYDSKNTM